MYFKRKSNILFRDYKSFGYITDNRNFDYKKTNNSIDDIGDKIVSKSGAIFLSVLGKKTQDLDELALKIKEIYQDVDISILREDAREFYCMLEKDGFVVSGRTKQECDEKDIRFSYSTPDPNFRFQSYPNKVHTEVSTGNFLNQFFNGKPQLTSVHIEITSRCNEKCVHCYIPQFRKVSDIDSQLFFEIIEQCKTLNVLHLTLSGGEPMLHKNFRDFLRTIRENDFAVNVLSNLTFLNDNILEEMKSNPLLGVQVSLYSMDSQIHDNITQNKGSFQKTINAILKLVDNDIPLQISCPIMKQNKDSYKDVVKWAKKLNLHVGADFAIIGGYGNSIQNLDNRLSIDEIKDVMQQMALNDTNYVKQLANDAAEKKRNMSGDDVVCSVCRSSICIADNGNVYPCAGWQDYVVGSIKETRLSDIWENSEKVKYLRSLRNKKFTGCMQCDEKEFCTICMVRNANENHGDPFKVSEFFCEVAILNREIVHKNKQPNN